MFKYDVLCIGSATIDNFLVVEPALSSIKLGDKVLVNSIKKSTGGGATNSAAALSKLGLKVKVLTKLGTDHDADFINQELKQFKISNICVHHSRKSTDFSTITSSKKERDRVIYVHKGASLDLNTTDFKMSQLNKAKWIYLASLMDKSFQTAKKIALHTQKKKTKLLFNPSLYLAKKSISYLKPVLEATNILVLNKEEAQALLKIKSNSFRTLLHKLNKLGPETVVITNGRKELAALHENKIYTLIPPDVKVVNTAGAGDAFTSGLLSGLIKNYPFTNALQLGLVNSLSVIQHLGTKTKLLTEKEAKRLMKKYKIKVKIH